MSFEMKRAFLFLVCFLVCFVFSLSVKAADESLFGLNWGMTPEQIEALGVKLEPMKTDKNFTILKTESLPKNLSDAEAYQLMFDRSRGLVKLVLVSKNIENDAYGTEGKKRFEELKSILSGKYPLKPSGSMETVGLKLWKNSDEFYQCLNYDGCGMWAAMFEPQNMTILLQLHGMARGKGYYKLSAEAKPEFDEALVDYKGAKKAAEADAL